QQCASGHGPTKGEPASEEPAARERRHDLTSRRINLTRVVRHASPLLRLMANIENRQVAANRNIGIPRSAHKRRAAGTENLMVQIGQPEDLVAGSGQSAPVTHHIGRCYVDSIGPLAASVDVDSWRVSAIQRCRSRGWRLGARYGYLTSVRWGQSPPGTPRPT